MLHVGPDELLQSLHWGPRLDVEQAASLLEQPEPRSRSVEDPADGTLALSPTGGYRYAHAGLQIRFADGTRTLDLAFRGARVEGQDTLVLSFEDRCHPLAVEAFFRVVADTDVIERRMVVRHTGGPEDEPFEVLRADSATWVLPGLEDYRISQVRGQWAAEHQLDRTRLPFGETRTASRRGISSHHANPWVMVDDGTASEQVGQVYGCALAWSGSWELVAERTGEDRVALSLGADHPGSRIALAPGEEWPTPVCAGQFTHGGFGAASRAWHRYLRSHVVPHPQELRPVLYNSWEATGFDISLEGQLALADRAARLGVELFVMDDGWFGARTHDAAGLGDWTPNPDRFPDGLAPLTDHVHSLGMAFGLWVEPEMTNPDSDLYRSHPDWVVHAPNRPRTEVRNQLVLDLSRDEVAAFVHDTVDRLLRENAVDFLKWDMNRPLTEVADDRIWSAYVRNLYGILDRLRAAHPAVRIENCSSGGGRTDLGLLARTDQTWISDNTDAADRLHIQHGFSQLYPAQVMGAWVTDSPNPFTGRTTPLAYRFHAAMAGVLGIGADLASWDEAELGRAASLVAQYKAIRPTVQQGRQYRLRPPVRNLSAVQYVSADRSEAVVLAFRLERRFGRTDPALALRGLDPAARYREAGTGRVHHAAVLLARGLPLDLPADDRASNLVHLQRVEHQP
ncbi:alpha-galactosidase [Streptacidiphilus carbonis]|uniref:alpha-galactosidase n=1 Tax=Streptacidiphilus carbonis TaxID=105422 RepID=UPI0034E1D0C1